LFTVISGENDDIISELKTQILEKIGFDSSDLSQAYFDMTESDPDLALEELESLPFLETACSLYLKTFGI
jgi:DNA polymerase-3 subunit delta